MFRPAIVSLLTLTLALAACNDQNKNKIAADDTSYGTGSTKSDTYGSSDTTYRGSSTGGSSTTYQPTYTATTTTPPSTYGTDTSGSTGTVYNTTASSPPVTTTVVPSSGSNAEMSSGTDSSVKPRSTRSSGSSGSGGGRTYVVKEGDSLSKIAAKFYGDGNKWPRILKANKNKIPNQNKLKPGTKLVIP